METAGKQGARRECAGAKAPTKVEARNLTLRESPSPPGHDGARQTLSELRRMIDADWHRIRKNLCASRRIADERRSLKRNHALNSLHHRRRAMAGAMMASAIFLGIRVLMLRRFLMPRCGVRIEFITVAAQRKQGD